jgi:uncharacterized cupin superfamily protein
MGPPLYHARIAPLGRLLGARKLAFHVRIQPPRTVLCPYHAHHVNEELFVVLGGSPGMRIDGREHRLEAGDLVALPPGPDSAHQFLNRGPEPAHVLALSTAIPYELLDYPDSAKRALGTRLPKRPAPIAGTEAGEASPIGFYARVLLRDGKVADYLDGEPAFDVFEHEPEPGARDPRVVRMADVPWEPHALGSFRAERKRLSRAARAHLLGYGLYRLRPGDRPWPFHFHHVNEEFFYVRSGHGQLRTRDGTRDLGPGDAFVCPPGPEGAHGILNTGDGPLEYFALSTMEEPEIAEYPDSGKLGVMVGSSPGGDSQARSVAAVFRMADNVDYLEGEQ